MPSTYTPRQALNKAYLKIKPLRTEVDAFKERLTALLQQANEKESEEFNKNVIATFLKQAFYEPKYFINTKGRNDLVVHNGPSAKDTVGVLIEAKRPSNKNEMPKLGSLNVKAMHELLLYYLRERITHENLEIRHLIITNSIDWFIFDAQVFERCFAAKSSLIKQFQQFELGKLSGSTTDFFYKNIAEPAIGDALAELSFTYFTLAPFLKSLLSGSEWNDKDLIPLLKVLSPQHLLKTDFINDNNSLNKGFYAELLHLMGLYETKESGAKVIKRRPADSRIEGTLIENAISEIGTLDKIGQLKNKKQYGKTLEEQTYNVALELAITWIDRLLFLKLLEAQLVKYHRGDASYAFLNTAKVPNFNELNTLFFRVLAVRPSDRIESVKSAFSKVPYLNSSLFELTELEQQAIAIANLNAAKTVPLLGSTVLKSKTGKKRSGEIRTLEYIFEFLDAYDFAGDGIEDIQEDNKTLISASVLGLIFEKINGYKDGSFFTPGFVTMYMSREAIRDAVIQKFNSIKGWKCKDFTELYDKIDDRAEANAIINSIKVCDPAVGSGHFLVSALNELIAIKAELNLLQDKVGRRLKEYDVAVVNDELIVTDEDGKIVDYWPDSKESTRVQETLFREKRELIESCLFGVDINPNSVKICRLRLWIELLKNAYYKADGELETLPNIDINIKCGNSLISRFAVDVDLKSALKKSKLTITQYRAAVDSYRNATDKSQKRDMERVINDVKTNFVKEIYSNDPKVIRLEGLKAKLRTLQGQQSLFPLSAKEAREKKAAEQDLQAQVARLSAKIQAIRDSAVFEGAFEWRFEFPEVLSDSGEYVGFDVVIGNPPYISAIALKKKVSALEYSYYKSEYSIAKGTVDLYVYFFELASRIGTKKSTLCYISPNRYLSASYGAALRAFLIGQYTFLTIGDYSNVTVFSEAQTYPVVSLLRKDKPSEDYKFSSFTYSEKSGVGSWRYFASAQLTSINENILGFVLSDKYPIALKVIARSVSLDTVGSVNATSTAAEASDFGKLVPELKAGFKLINTGTIDRYVARWGAVELRDGGAKYLRPHLPKKRSVLGESRFDLYSSPKIILAKIALRAEAFYDEAGEYASINTNCVHSMDKGYAPLYVLAWLNSCLFQYIYECFYDGLKMAGGYLPYNAPSLCNMYIPRATAAEQKKVIRLASDVLASKKVDPDADTADLESAIDEAFYELCQLTPVEVAHVEASSAISVAEADTGELEVAGEDVLAD